MNKDELLEKLNKAKQILEQINEEFNKLEEKKEEIGEEEYKKQFNELTYNKAALEEFIMQTSATLEKEAKDGAISEDMDHLKENIGVTREEIKKQQDYAKNGRFVERSNNLVKNSEKTVLKIQNLASVYKEIPKKWAEKKAEIVREKERIISASIEERKKMMNDVCDRLEEELKAIENDPSLTEEEKRQKIQEKDDELAEKIYLIEEFPNLNNKEQNKKLEEELEVIDKAIYADQKQLKKQMAHAMTMQILLLGRYLDKNYDLEEIYNALLVLAEIELEDKELEEFLKKTFDETLMRNPELQKIYIAYSEKKAFEDEQLKPEKNIIKNGVDAIEELLNIAEKNLDRKALDKACDLISKMSNGDDKNDLQARAAEIDKLIREKDKDNDNDKSLGDGDDLEPPKPELPKMEGKAPNKTWKTWVSLAAGIGVGAAVFFTCGGVGVSVMAIAGGISKRLIEKRRKKLEMQRLNGELPIEEIEEPQPGIKGQIDKLKRYFKSEEFCRDAKWFLNGAIYTGLGLNVASSIHNLVTAKFGADVPMTPDNVTPTNDVPTGNITNTANVTPEPIQPDPMSGIKLGENVGDYNVSIGHDTASWATNGTNAENLISKYVNGDSIFKRFAVMNPDGSVAQMINTNGLSITDFCNQSGIDPSSIAVDVANKSGTSQAWVSVSELLKGVGGKSL